MGFSFNIKSVPEDRDRRILLLAFILSVLFHIFLFWLLNQKNWLKENPVSLKDSPPEEVTIIFPENKPKTKPKEWKIVDNTNENEEIPEKTDLLSNMNSRARNPELTKELGEIPNSKGNVPFADLSPLPKFKSFPNFQSKPFNRKALIGEGSEESSLEKEYTKSKLQEAQSSTSKGANQILDQKKFSVEDLGALSLSTYRWEWAPYVNALKQRLYQVWFTPPAYYRLGLISGYTIVQFTIDRTGQLTNLNVLKQVGHKSLELSSTEAIKAIFPFLPLPEDFPEESLTITAKLIYPDLRRGR